MPAILAALLALQAPLSDVLAPLRFLVGEWTGHDFALKLKPCSHAPGADRLRS